MYILVPTLSTNTQTVTVLSTQSTVLECVPSNPKLSIRWVLYQTDGSRIPITFDGRDLFGQTLNKRNVQLLPSIETRFPHHNITITSADVSLHSGLYVCSVETPRGDTTVISRNITVNVLPGQLIHLVGLPRDSWGPRLKIWGLCIIKFICCGPCILQPRVI